MRRARNVRKLRKDGVLARNGKRYPRYHITVAHSLVKKLDWKKGTLIQEFISGNSIVFTPFKPGILDSVEGDSPR